MAGKHHLRDDVRRTTLPRLPLPSAAEGAGRLFDWADDLSSDALRALTRPDADWAAITSDFAAVGHDLHSSLEVLTRHLTTLGQNPLQGVFARLFAEHPDQVTPQMRALIRYLRAMDRRWMSGSDRRENPDS